MAVRSPLLLARSALGLVALLSAATSAHAADDEAAPATGKPVWEAGLVAGGGRVPDYPGAAQSHARGLLAPLLVYRGPLLRIDEEGVRGRLIRHPDWELDLTASAAFNARSNEARAGMPPLDYLFGLGPQLVYKGWRERSGAPTLHLKLSAMVSTDFHRLHERGAVFEPELRWHLAPTGPAAGMRVTVGLQPTWASRALNAWFYEVTPDQATPIRPAYRARAGYLGTQLRLSLSRRIDERLSWFVAAQAQSLHGSANADSPLLLRHGGVGMGIGLLWTPWRSTTRVGAD